METPKIHEEPSVTDYEAKEVGKIVISAMPNEEGHFDVIRVPTVPDTDRAYLPA